MRDLSPRSPIARARGLGSAKGGVEHWWAERVTAVALVPLTIWFAASMSGASSETTTSLPRAVDTI